MRLNDGVARCSNWEQRDVKSMGSRAKLIIGDPPRGTADWAVAHLEELEMCWTRFRPASELNDLNRSSGRWFPMSPMLTAAVDRACALHSLTGGRFDPSVLPCLIGLGYDRSFSSLSAGGVSRSPDFDPVPALGLDGIERDGPWIRLPEGLGLDLGGVGKGLAADIIATGLVDRGAASACISMGGDIRVAGDVPDGGWIIPVADPREHGTTLGHVAVFSGALVTSTVKYRRWERNGREFHHLIDPTSGDSARGGVLAAIVRADEAWLAEGIAKAAVIAGREMGAEHIESCGASGWLITDDGRLQATLNAPPLLPIPTSGINEGP